MIIDLARPNISPEGWKIFSFKNKIILVIYEDFEAVAERKPDT
jgi:hypothetical protein